MSFDVESESSFRVEAKFDYVRLIDEDGEIVYWDDQEWKDNPSLVITIASTISYGYEHGPKSLRQLLEKHDMKRTC